MTAGELGPADLGGRDYGALATICGRQADYAMDLDRTWFREHPGRDRYVRPAIAHEHCELVRAFAGITDVCVDAVETVVIQLAPGVRCPQPAEGYVVLMGAA